MTPQEVNASSWLHRLLNRLLDKRDIVVDGQLYLRRWYLWQGRPKYSGAVFLHCILEDDAGVHLHDHPWDFRTVGLLGCYVEELAQKLPGSFANPLRGYCTSGYGRAMHPGRTWCVPAEHRHRVHVVDGPAWTLVFTGPARRTWGFWVNGRWVDWRRHLGYAPDHPDWPEDAFEKASSTGEWQER